MDPAQRRLLTVVGGIVAVTVLALLLLWPEPVALPAIADRAELVDGRVTSVEFFEEEPDEFLGLSGEMVRLDIEVLEGDDAGTVTRIESPVEGYPTFREGDRVKLSPGGVPGEETQYFVSDFRRTVPLWTLGIIFVLAVVGIGGWHGLRSLTGLAISLFVVVRFVVPGIITGQNPVLIGLVGAVAVMIVTLYLAHGVNAMTTAAVVGTSAALVVTVLLGAVFVEVGKLTGFSSEEATLARFVVEGLDLQGLVLAGLIIAALGVLDDVTVTQASTVFALRDADPGMGVTELFRRAMVVGRDHIASTVNTLFLAYTGASLALMVLFSTGGLPVAEILNSEVVAEELIKTLVGSIGLISAVPITTFLSATVAVGGQLGTGGAHVHAHPHPVVSGEAPPATEDEAAYAAWVKFLREGPPDLGDTPPSPDGDEGP